MQAITAMRLLVHHGQLRRVLLVCPKPLVTNWQREFAQWAPELPVERDRRGPARRQWQWRADGDVVTNCQLRNVVRDRDEVCRADNHFDLVVLDESQRIKNAASTTNEVVRSIPACRSWALTGTPIENSVEDLLGIFEFVAPGQLEPKMKPRAVGRAVSDYVLRRTKDQVLIDLPPKLFRDADVELSPEQVESYRLAEDEGVVRPSRNEAGADDPARLRAGAAAEANLQFRSGHRREQQTRTAGSRPGRMRRERPQGDRLQPMGADAHGAEHAAGAFRPARISRPGSEPSSATTSSTNFATIRTAT